MKGEGPGGAGVTVASLRQLYIHRDIFKGLEVNGVGRWFGLGE